MLNMFCPRQSYVDIYPNSLKLWMRSIATDSIWSKVALCWLQGPITSSLVLLVLIRISFSRVQLVSVRRKLHLRSRRYRGKDFCHSCIFHIFMCQATWSQVINLNQKGQWPHQKTLRHRTTEVLPAWCFSFNTGCLLSEREIRKEPSQNALTHIAVQ